MSPNIIAFLMAAGKGERMRPLTGLIPKPLLPVCTVPMYRFAHALAGQAGAHSCVMNFSYGKELFEESWSRYQSLSLPITWSFEEGGPYGTLGALSFARNHLERADQILILNCEPPFHCDMRAFLRYHQSHAAPATLLLKRFSTPQHPFSSLLVDEEGYITGIERSPERKSNLVFCGVHLWNRSLLDLLPDQHQGDLVKDLYLPHLIPQRKIKAFVVDSYFSDLGTPSYYAASQFELLDLLYQNEVPWLKAQLLETHLTSAHREPSRHLRLLLNSAAHIPSPLMRLFPKEENIPKSNKISKNPSPLSPLPLVGEGQGEGVFAFHPPYCSFPSEFVASEIPPSTEIIPPVLIAPHCHIGTNCQLGPYAILGEKSQVGDHSHIHHSILLPETLISASADIRASLVWGNTNLLTCR